MKLYRLIGMGLFFLLILLSPNPATANQEISDQQTAVQPLSPTAPQGPDVLITWFTHDVDTTSGRGRYNDIAIDSNGYPHISYIDEGTSNLMYAYQDSGGWHRWILDGHDPAETIGWGTALVLDAENDPHILYFGTMDVRYMFKSGGGWYREFVEPSLIADGGDIFLGADGTVYASYHEALTDFLVYAERNKNTGLWSSYVVDTTKSPGHNTSLVVKDNGDRAISYSRYEDPALLIAESSDGANWSTFTLEADVGIHATHTDMAITEDDDFIICFFDKSEFDYRLLVTRGSGGGWRQEVVDSSVTVDEQSPEVASECSLAVDSTGVPHIAYYDAGSLEYAYRDPQGGWNIGTTIEPDDINEEPAGRHNGLAIGPGDWLHVSYDYTYSPTLKHADVAFFTPDLVGDTSCTYGSRDCNRCAHDVVNSVAKLSVYGEPLGFHMGTHPEPSFNWKTGDVHGHWQGVQRISSLSGDYLIVSHDDMKVDGNDWSGLAIVRMDSRDEDGYRWRSNRLEVNKDFKDTAPPSEDIIVKTEYITKVYDHPGGFQIMGDYLPIGTDRQVRLYDMANPEAPVELKMILDRPGFTSSSTSLAKLANRHYLLVVSNSDARQIDFYYSSQPDLLSGFTFLDSYHQDDHAYQSMNLVTECGTGDMYLVGTYNGGRPWGAPTGEDRAVVFLIKKTPGNEVTLEEKLSKHFHCAYSGEADCNFDAGAGIYVDRGGQIILYSTEHDNKGPSGDESRSSVKAKEFRPVPHINMCSDINQAWVELYDDHDFKDRNLMIDYIDRNLEDYGNYHHVEDFNDKPTSVRWCLPPNWRYSLYWDNSYSGKELVLTGTGGSREISNLKDHDFNQASSSQFVYDPAVQISISDILGDILYYRRSSGTSALMTIDEELNHTVGVDVEVPAGAVSQASTLTLTPAYPPAHPIDGYLSPDSLSFDLDLTPKVSDDFLAPVTLRYYFDPQHAENIQMDTLAIYVWDAGGNQWVDAAHTCNPMSTYTRDLESGVIEVDICRTGEYILMGDRQYRVFLPSTLNRP